MLCAKRQYSGSVLPVTKKVTLQFMFMLGQYLYLCLMEEFPKLKDRQSAIYCITFDIRIGTYMVYDGALHNIHIAYNGDVAEIS